MGLKCRHYDVNGGGVRVAFFFKSQRAVLRPRVEPVVLTVHPAVATVLSQYPVHITWKGMGEEHKTLTAGVGGGTRDRQGSCALRTYYFIGFPAAAAIRMPVPPHFSSHPLAESYDRSRVTFFIL